MGVGEPVARFAALEKAPLLKLPSPVLLPVPQAGMHPYAYTRAISGEMNA